MTETTAAPPAATPPPPKPRPGKPTLFDCPACGGAIKLNAVGHSVSAVCMHCGSLVDTNHKTLRLLQRAHEKLRPSVLTLGARGTLAGKKWQVIGWIEKQDTASRSTWDEFLLFNPYYGFRFLVHADGHWSLLGVVKQSVAAPEGLRSLEFERQHFTLFQEGETKVTYAAGEFYWRVKRGETTKVQDFIAPPFLLSIERADDELNVAYGEYVSAKAVASAFGAGDRFPTPRGVAPNQPSPYTAKLRAIIKPSFIFIAAAILVQIGAIVLSDNRVLVEKQFVTRAADKEKTVVIPALQLSNELADVVVETRSNLNNQWLEVDFQLVNEQTDQSYIFRNAMDYYSGYDGGESWSEGSNHTDSVLPMVPGGEYTLIAEVDSSVTAAGQDVSWTLRVRRDVALWANFWTALALATLIPLYLAFRHFGFEKQRWSQSDHAPSWYTESGDD